MTVAHGWKDAHGPRRFGTQNGRRQAPPAVTVMLASRRVYLYSALMLPHVRSSTGVSQSGQPS